MILTYLLTDLFLYSLSLQFMYEFERKISLERLTAGDLFSVELKGEGYKYHLFISFIHLHSVVYPPTEVFIYNRES